MRYVPPVLMARRSISQNFGLSRPQSGTHTIAGGSDSVRTTHFRRRLKTLAKGLTKVPQCVLSLTEGPHLRGIKPRPEARQSLSLQIAFINTVINHTQKSNFTVPNISKPNKAHLSHTHYHVSQHLRRQRLLCRCRRHRFSLRQLQGPALEGVPQAGGHPPALWIHRRRNGHQGRRERYVKFPKSSIQIN